ncbi:MAG: 50S ribosomal protein L10 [Planctomycetota bacterium]|nr:MAG: 50S ribosomal protein L10 [Planctomycetota bacterium]
MSKAVKELLVRDYKARLEGVQDALVISVRGVPANDTNRLRLGLAGKSIRVTVVRNALAKRAFADSSLAELAPVLEGPSALAYGAESVVDVARELVKWAKEVQNLELKGAVLDGQLFEGPAGVEALSKFPTREEAVAQAVTLVLSPGRNLMAQIKGPGARVAGLIKAIEEKLEKGEAIAKAG